MLSHFTKSCSKTEPSFAFQETGAKNIVGDLATKKKNMVLEILNITANDTNLDLKDVVQEKVSNLIER